MTNVTITRDDADHPFTIRDEEGVVLHDDVSGIPEAFDLVDEHDYRVTYVSDPAVREYCD